VKLLVIEIPDGTIENIELASDQLWQLGVRAIEERLVSDGVELWSVVGESDGAFTRAVTGLDSRWNWRIEEVDLEPAETWREFAAPMWINSGLVVVPAWQSHSFDDSPLVLHIEPGAAFGLGDHPTTDLSLRALSSLMPCLQPRPVAVLDVGCGTGVLAIAAALLGASRVRAVDVAASAVEATTDNAVRNGVLDRIEVDSTTAADLVGSYDVVVANILAPVLVLLADDLRRLTAPEGHLIVSGILANEHAHVLEALAPMRVVQREVLDEWAAIMLTH
jgi:ribosomal protein L11 methyltransferase